MKVDPCHNSNTALDGQDEAKVLKHAYCHAITCEREQCTSSEVSRSSVDPAFASAFTSAP